MRNIARLPENDRRELFRNTADKMGLCKERYYAKKQGKPTWFSRSFPAFSLHKNYLPRDFSHSRVSVFVIQDGVAGGMTKKCFSSAHR